MRLREHGTIVLVATIAAVAFIAVASAGAIHSACFEALPFAEPQAGTARSTYCNAIEPTYPWISLTVLPVLFVTVVGLLTFRTSKLYVIVVAICISIGLVVNAVVAHNLNASYSFP